MILLALTLIVALLSMLLLTGWIGGIVIGFALLVYAVALVVRAIVQIRRGG